MSSRNRLIHQICEALFLKGTSFVISYSSPFFWVNIWCKFFQSVPNIKEKQKFRSTFNYLKRKNLIIFEKRKKQIYISLTEKGRKIAGKYKIDNLRIESQKVWDGRWRVAIFDIPEDAKIRREAFRGKLKELGFYPLQKSVWIFPYPCHKEIILLREFFGLGSKNIMVIEANKIDNDRYLKDFFGL